MRNVECLRMALTPAGSYIRKNFRNKNHGSSGAEYYPDIAPRLAQTIRLKQRSVVLLHKDQLGHRQQKTDSSAGSRLATENGEPFPLSIQIFSYVVA